MPSWNGKAVTSSIVFRLSVKYWPRSVKSMKSNWIKHLFAYQLASDNENILVRSFPFVITRWFSLRSWSLFFLINWHLNSYVVWNVHSKNWNWDRDKMSMPYLHDWSVKGGEGEIFAVKLKMSLSCFLSSTRHWCDIRVIRETCLKHQLTTQKTYDHDELRSIFIFFSMIRSDCLFNQM